MSRALVGPNVDMRRIHGLEQLARLEMGAPCQNNNVICVLAAKRTKGYVASERIWDMWEWIVIDGLIIKA
jgi:hypothetical protein